MSVWLPLVLMVASLIATLNVNGIRGDGKRTLTFKYLRSLKYDFYLLQETHVQAEDFEEWSVEWLGALFLESWRQ